MLSDLGSDECAAKAPRHGGRRTSDRSSRTSTPEPLQNRPNANAGVTVVHTGVPDWARYTMLFRYAVQAAETPST